MARAARPPTGYRASSASAPCSAACAGEVRTSAARPGWIKQLPSHRGCGGGAYSAECKGQHLDEPTRSVFPTGPEHGMAGSDGNLEELSQKRTQSGAEHDAAHEHDNCAEGSTTGVYAKKHAASSKAKHHEPQSPAR